MHLYLSAKFFFVSYIRLLHLWNHTFCPYKMNLFNVFQLKFCHMDFTTFFVYTCLTYWLTLRETERSLKLKVYTSAESFWGLTYSSWSLLVITTEIDSDQLNKERNSWKRENQLENFPVKKGEEPSTWELQVAGTDAQSPQTVTAGMTQSQLFSVSLLLWSRIKFQGASVLLA